MAGSGSARGRARVCLTFLPGSRSSRIARALVDANWPSIRVIAYELVRLRRLDYSAVRQLILRVKRGRNCVRFDFGRD